MDAGSVSRSGAPGARPWPHWGLRPDIARLTQSIVVTGHGRFPAGLALFLELPADHGGGAWLRALEEVAPVTPARAPDRTEGEDAAHALAIAFTWTGLRQMGMPPTALASFARPFREGMFQEDRLRRLGDRRGGLWQPTTGGQPPLWSGNTPLAPAGGRIGAYDVLYAEPEDTKPVLTDLTVHALLLLYTPDEDSADALEARIAAALSPFGIRIVHRRELVLDVEHQRGFSREHFGFADGLSQPEPYDEGGAVMLDGSALTTASNQVQGTPLGEFLIGYRNGHHENAPGPVVPGTRDDRSADDRPRTAGLEPHPEAQGFFDFGLNGSYLVVRELRQDVAAFWRSMDANAAAIRAADPDHSADVTSTWLAERVIGRDRDGNLLCPAGVLPLDARGNPDNGFLFLERDPRGLGCPCGSHVRRANPRDALASSPEAGPSLLASANNHRILRRGRKYGTRIPNDRQDDGEERGLLFMCLNTDIARQFEFVQQTWLLNSDFATLFDEVDPLVGPSGRMTIPADPLRRAVHVETFVTMRGGEYFFLPSLPALRYLAEL